MSAKTYKAIMQESAEDTFRLAQEIIDEKDADLLRLRAAASEADALRTTVAAQARQIEAAREIIDVVARLGIGDGTFVRIGNDTWPKCSDVILSRAWLAANAPDPAPAAAEVTK